MAASQQIDFDIVVVGAGPAGIAAAVVAAGAGRRVAVLDNTPWPGGAIWRSPKAQPDSARARRWLERMHNSGALLFCKTTVFAAPAPHALLAETPEGTMELRWGQLVLAVGARELFLPFPGWTLPNVFGVGGLQTLVKAGWPIAGKRVIVAGSGPLLLAVAADLRRQGAEIVSVNEQACAGRVLRFGAALPWLAPTKLFQAIACKYRLLGVPYRLGCWPISAQGDGRVESVTLTNGRKIWNESCDYLACAFGLAPNLELPRLLGCKVENGFVRVNEWQETSAPDVYCAGEPAGIGGMELALIEGQIAGFSATGRRGMAQRLFQMRRRALRFSAALERAFSLRTELRELARGDTIVCRCEDVPRQQLEAYGDLHAAKLQTRCGMGPCQGRICGGALHFMFGWESDNVRPPLLPVQINSLAACDGRAGGGDVSNQVQTQKS